MKTLTKPLAAYLLIGTSMSLLYCFWGSLFPLDRWRHPLNALLNVLLGTLLLVVYGVVPSAVATSLALFPRSGEDTLSQFASTR
jgi:hypothetical protein